MFRPLIKRRSTVPVDYQCRRQWCACGRRFAGNSFEFACKDHWPNMVNHFTHWIKRSSPLPSLALSFSLPLAAWIRERTSTQGIKRRLSLGTHFRSIFAFHRTTYTEHFQCVCFFRFSNFFFENIQRIVSQKTMFAQSFDICTLKKKIEKTNLDWPVCWYLRLTESIGDMAFRWIFFQLDFSQNTQSLSGSFRLEREAKKIADQNSLRIVFLKMVRCNLQVIGELCGIH